jgi:hypothetical protein
MRPRDASGDKTLKLATDNHDVGDHWILTDGYHVSIVQQKLGEKPKQEIRVPRRAFNAMIDWYMREQKQLKRTG